MNIETTKGTTTHTITLTQSELLTLVVALGETTDTEIKTALVRDDGGLYPQVKPSDLTDSYPLYNGLLAAWEAGR